jgi:hypothetical protein
MEIEWEDRGKIAFEAWKGTENYCADYVAEWWNRVFDACSAANVVTVPGGNQILIVENENGKV